MTVLKARDWLVQAAEAAPAGSLLARYRGDHRHVLGDYLTCSVAQRELIPQAVQLALSYGLAGCSIKATAERGWAL
jgi:hypothetical protein